ncbi:hypothetical protein J4480_04380 [Candidatus Woesearchaeota archaeon]|nr:hypothetical protein [Candidatus Woesearchaeota archaeon]
MVLPNIAYAKPYTEALKGGLVEINNFFTNEQYKPYAKTIDFFFFALLFIAIYMMGVRYAFKEVKRPEQVIAILLGLMTAFLLVLGGFSATLLLPYIQWLLYVLLFILYWWMLKGIKNKFWRFVLALLLTLLTIAGVQWLFSALAAPEAGAVDTSGIAGFFKSLGDSFKGIDTGFQPGTPQWLQDLFETPGAAAPSGPGTLPSTTTPSGVVATPAAEKGFFGRNWWWIIPLLFLSPFAFRVPREWVRNRFRRAGRPPTEPTSPTREIINKIVDIKTEKNEAKANIELINREKNNLIRQGDVKTGYIAKLQEILRKDNGEEDLANLFLDPSKTLEELEEGNVKEIIKKEREFVKELKKLGEVESELYGKIKNPQDPQGWQNIILQNLQDVPDERKNGIRNLLYLLKVLMDENVARRAEDKQKGILWLIAFCYNLEKKQNILARDLGNLFDDNHIKDLVKGKFKDAITDEARLEAYNQRENEIVALLLRRISAQVDGLDRLKMLIEQGQQPQQGQATPQPTPTLTLEITNPTPNTPHEIGRPIDGLQAVIKDTAGNVVDPATLGKVFFIWYIGQEGKPPIRILIGNNRNSRPIPNAFIPGPAKLGVVVVDQKKNIKVQPREIDIELVSSIGPPAGGPLVPTKPSVIPGKMPFYIHPEFLKPGTTYPYKQERGALPHSEEQKQKIEIEEIKKEITEFDEWFIREEIKAGRSRNRGRMSEYKQRFLGILKGIEEERHSLVKRINKSEKAIANKAQVDYLLDQLDENIAQARKTYRFEYLNATKDNIHDLTSLTSDARLPVGYKEGKAKVLYNRAKQKQARIREEVGGVPFEAFRAETKEERDAWEQYQELQVQQELNWKKTQEEKIAKLRQQETTARAAPTIKPSPATDLSEKEAEFDALIGRLKRAPVAEDIIRKLNRRFGT